MYFRKCLTFCLPPFGGESSNTAQALEESRLRCSLKHEPLTAEEARIDQAKKRAFFGTGDAALSQGQESLAKRRKTNENILAPQPRVATAQFIRRWDHFVRLYKEGGLEHFVNWHILERAGVLEGVRTGKFPDEAKRLAYGAQPAAPVASVVTDQEQSQLTGEDYVLTQMEVTGVRNNDWFHRKCNDLTQAQARAGLTTAYWAMTFAYNLGQGPWETALWYRQQLAQLEHLAKTLTGDDILPLRFWPGILLDHRRHHERGDAEVGKKAREDYVRTLDTEKALKLRGVKVKPSNWMSFNAAHSQWDPWINTRAMCLGALCINKGWIPTAEDLFNGAKGLVKFGTEECGAKPPSAAAAAKSAKAKVQQLKNRSANCVAAAAKVLADKDAVFAGRLLALGSRAEFSEFNEVTRTLKSADASAAFSESCAQWGWLKPLKEGLLCLRDTLELERCGIESTFTRVAVSQARRNHAVVALQDARSKTLGNFVVEIIRARTGSMLLWSAQYPNKLAGLCAARSQERTMREFKADVEAWWAAKERSVCSM